MLMSVLLVVLPLSVELVPSVVGFGVVLTGLPVYAFFVMETPWRLRPKIFDRINGENLLLCIQSCILIMHGLVGLLYRTYLHYSAHILCLQ